jgi:hypothetical protein
MLDMARRARPTLTSFKNNPGRLFHIFPFWERSFTPKNSKLETRNLKLFRALDWQED